MECPKCGEAVEAGAAFCGNCGQSLSAPTVSAEPASSPIQQVMANQPAERAEQPDESHHVTGHWHAWTGGRPVFACCRPDTRTGRFHPGHFVTAPSPSW